VKVIESLSQLMTIIVVLNVVNNYKDAYLSTKKTSSLNTGNTRRVNGGPNGSFNLREALSSQ
jgi:hypothetical protein